MMTDKDLAQSLRRDVAKLIATLAEIETYIKDQQRLIDGWRERWEGLNELVEERTAQRDELQNQLDELAKQEPKLDYIRRLEREIAQYRAAPPAPVVLPEPYCVVCDYVYDAQELRDALDLAGVKWVRKGEADE